MKTDTIQTAIGEAIETMNAEDTNEQGKEVETQVSTQASVPVAQESTPTTAFVADDALIERAVKAGLSVADAKAFANAEQADRILNALEAKAKPDGKTTETTNENGDGFPAEEFEEAIKEMEGDGDYNPMFVHLFKQLGTVVKAQSETIKALKSAGATAEAKTVFDKSFAGLDEGVRNHIDAATKSQLKKKFDFLKEAHKSAKDGATEEDVFNEAKKLVLGDIEAKYAEENKAAALAQRKSLLLARPGGESGNRGTDRPMNEEGIAEMLFQQLTK